MKDENCAQKPDFISTFHIRKALLREMDYRNCFGYVTKKYVDNRIQYVQVTESIILKIWSSSKNHIRFTLI